MKKIGLAVCYNAKNFGSQLQLLANAKKIEELGYQVEIIRYNKKVTPVFVLQTIPRLFNIRFLRGKLRSLQKRKSKAADPEIAKNLSLRRARFNQFADAHFPASSEPYAGWETLVKKAKENYDGFVCGSDQLWLPNNLGSHFYTLEFAPDNKPKIAYSTSFGVSEIPWFQKTGTAKYLNRFQSLSTREIAGSRIIEELTGRKAQVVCDPTMLYDADDWNAILPSKRIIEQPYIFAYFLGTNPSHRKAAEELKEKTGLTLVTCPFADSFVASDKDFGDVQMYDMDSADFVNLIRHAEFVLTDSFHGTVFSILNHRQFLTFNRFQEGKDSRNSRIDSLCTMLDLHNRRYTGQIDAIFDSVNYEQVEQRLHAFRSESIQYLKDALQKV